MHYRDQFKAVDHIHLKALQRDSISPWSNWKTYKELKDHYARLKPDLILHYTSKPNIFGGIAAGKLGIRNIAAVTGLGYAFIHNGLLSKLTKAMFRYADRYIDQFIFENEDDLALFRSELIAKDKGMSVKGCGVDTTHYTSSKPMPQIGKVVFTFIGRLLTDKGIMEFLKAARLAKQAYGPSIECWIVGEVDKQNPASIQYDNLLQWIDDGVVKYLGFQEDVRETIEASSCVVLPSYREGMPRTILEALAMARPVITTKVAGCRETVIEGQNGFLVEVRSSASLVEAIHNFMSLSYQEKVEMGQKGRHLAETVFDSKRIAQNIYLIIEGTLEI